MLFGHCFAQQAWDPHEELTRRNLRLIGILVGEDSLDDCAKITLTKEPCLDVSHKHGGLFSSTWSRRD